MAWTLRLVKTGAEGEGPCTDIMEINRPDDPADIANLGLTLSEAKPLLAGVQREVVAAQAREHAVRRPDCSCCGGVCRVKDYRDHAVATLFGEVTLRLPRFRCAACGGIEAGVGWPSHCRSTPELDQLQAHLCAVMTYRTAADLLGQMFPVDAGKHHATLRRHTLKVGEALGECAVIRLETAASAIVVTLAWFKKCHFQVTPEIDRALMVKGFLVLGVTLMALIGFRGGEASTGKRGWGPLVHEQKRE